MSNTLYAPFDPEPIPFLQARAAKALRRVWNSDEIAEKFKAGEPFEAPGNCRDNVFDYTDGMRLVVYLDQPPVSGFGPEHNNHLHFVLMSFLWMKFAPDHMKVLDCFAWTDVVQARIDALLPPEVKDVTEVPTGVAMPKNTEIGPCVIYVFPADGMGLPLP